MSIDTREPDLLNLSVGIVSAHVSHTIVPAGKRMKMLKRHFHTSYGMTPDAYRARWNLPPTYPMVAPNYANRRSDLAKSIGLGRKPGSAATDEVPVQRIPAGKRGPSQPSRNSPPRRNR